MTLPPTQRERRAALLDERRQVRPAQLDRHPFCQLRVTDACRRKAREATDVHEVVRRGQGGSITETRNLLSACHRCHMIVTTHPLFGEAIGTCLPGWVLEPAKVAGRSPKADPSVAYAVAERDRWNWLRAGWSTEFVLHWSEGKQEAVEADVAAARREAA